MPWFTWSSFVFYLWHAACDFSFSDARQINLAAQDAKSGACCDHAAFNANPVDHDP
jgi:hypothetical protein